MTAAAAPTRWRWLKLLCLAALAWVLAVAALATTRDPFLIPLTVTTGSFAVPVCAAIYVVDRLYDAAIPRLKIVEAFALGGTLGIVLAAVGEYLLLGRGTLEYAGVGLIEEAAKLVALWLVARRLRTYSISDGIVLGVAVGFGFASFESSGYALVALFGPHGLELHNMITTVLERGLFAPVGHGLWTGTLGGVLFMAARPDRLRLAPRVIAVYLLVALLHGLYDASAGLGALIVSVLCLVLVSLAGLLAMSCVWRLALVPTSRSVGVRGRARAFSGSSQASSGPSSLYDACSHRSTPTASAGPMAPTPRAPRSHERSGGRSVASRPTAA